MLGGCSYTVPLRGSRGAAGPAGRWPALGGVGSREALGAGACWEVALEGPGAAPCLCALSVPASASRGRVVGGPPAQAVALLRRLAVGPLHRHPPAQVGGQAEHILLVVVIRSHRVQQLLQRLPAEWAGISRPGPLPDAGKAEPVHTEGHVGCVFDVSQADGALGVCCGFRRPCLGRLAHAAVPCSRAALPHGFLAARRHVLPRETCKVLELVWWGGTQACSQPTAGCTGSRTGGGMA